MIRENRKLPALKQVSEMKHSALHSQQLSVESTVSALGGAQLLAEESQGAPRLLKPLLPKHSPDVCSGGVGDEGDVCC
jgi:hypothetical protein